eukprot:3333323-Amphidinium_carterae.2
MGEILDLRVLNPLSVGMWSTFCNATTPQLCRHTHNLSVVNREPGEPSTTRAPSLFLLGGVVQPGPLPLATLGELSRATGRLLSSS